MREAGPNGCHGAKASGHVLFRVGRAEVTGLIRRPGRQAAGGGVDR